jgi:glycosyltransferase involved in cell wall biosynthesis
MKVVAVIPAYNEASRIGQVVDGVIKVVDTTYVVDDGSQDDTGKVAAEHGAVVLRHPINRGTGAATMTGIVAARRTKADVIVTIDADGQHNPEDIHLLLKPLTEKQADIVIGSRFCRGRMKNKIPKIRILFNMIGNILTFMVTGLYVSDSQSGFKALGPQAIQQIQIHLSGFEFCTEIIREAKRHRWRIVEVPTRVLYSEYTLAKGQSFSRGVVTACKILLRAFLR